MTAEEYKIICLCFDKVETEVRQARLVIADKYLKGENIKHGPSKEMELYKEHKNLVKKFEITEEELRAAIESIDFTKCSGSIRVNMAVMELLYRGDISEDDKL